MNPNYRTQFNENFSTEKYNAFLQDITSDFDYKVTFRIGETPFFIPKELKQQLVEASNEVINFIKNKDFISLTDKALELNRKVPNEDNHTTFLAIDFGICEENGKIIPKLIEVQGFPSLYNFQYNLAEKFQNHYPFLSHLTPFFNGISKKEYLQIVEEAICNAIAKENVILLEIEPEKQNTQIDFFSTVNYLKIKVLCLTKVIKVGRQLFYKNEKDEDIRIEKIYNRVIFDELDRRPDLTFGFHFSEDLDVEWIGHPNWFFRISKYTLPFLKSEFVPKTYFLNDIDPTTLDLTKYVLKPLFSFSGQGVKINVTIEDIAAVEDKSNHILQEKVQYAPVLATPTGPAKVEIRMLLVWKKEWERPLLVNNLVRLSKGEMIGVRYNKDKDWVGASVGFFNPIE